jgi:hypothetical protein
MLTAVRFAGTAPIRLAPPVRRAGRATRTYALEDLALVLSKALGIAGAPAAARAAAAIGAVRVATFGSPARHLSLPGSAAMPRLRQLRTTV